MAKKRMKIFKNESLNEVLSADGITGHEVALFLFIKYCNVCKVWYPLPCIANFLQAKAESVHCLAQFKTLQTEHYSVTST